MLLGSTSPEFPSQGYKELPIILHWHWRKEGHDPPDPESRPCFSFLLFQCCTLSVQAARLQEGTSSSETFPHHDIWAYPFLFTSMVPGMSESCIWTCYTLTSQLFLMQSLSLSITLEASIPLWDGGHRDSALQSLPLSVLSVTSEGTDPAATQTLLPTPLSDPCCALINCGCALGLSC